MMSIYTGQDGHDGQIRSFSAQMNCAREKVLRWHYEKANAAKRESFGLNAAGAASNAPEPRVRGLPIIASQFHSKPLVALSVSIIPSLAVVAVGNQGGSNVHCTQKTTATCVARAIQQL
jgi:hypothetical protein